jgi:cytoskeletal protein CcmA (bactofilin family)
MHDAETIISAAMKVEGDLNSQGNVLIEGMVEGSLKTDKDLRVGQQAKITANVTASNAVIAGEVMGNVNVTERLELESTARVQGDINTKVLVVAAGATINGKLVMAEQTIEKPSRAARGRRAEEPAAVVEEAEEQREYAVVTPARRTINAFFTR